MKITIKRLTTPSLFLVAFVFIMSAAMWVFAYFLLPESLTADITVNKFWGNLLPFSSIGAHIAGYIFAILILFIIIRFNDKYAFINTRTFLHVFIYLLLVTTLISIQGNYPAYFATLFDVLAIFIFYGNYEKHQNSEASFLGFLLWGISTIFIPEYILLIPSIWIGQYIFKSLSFRSFIASLLGFATPFILIYGYLYIVTGVLSYYPDFIFIFRNLSVPDFIQNIGVSIYSAFIIILMGFIAVGIFGLSNRESIKTRKIIHFLLILGFSLLLVMFFYSNNLVSFLPLFGFLISLLGGYVFTLKKANAYSIVFYVFCFVSLLFAIYQIY